jgi:hypothetical protein
VPALCVGFGNHSTTGYCVLFIMPENTVSMLRDGFKTRTLSDSCVFLIILGHEGHKGKERDLTRIARMGKRIDTNEDEGRDLPRGAHKGRLKEGEPGKITLVMYFL